MRALIVKTRNWIEEISYKIQIKTYTMEQIYIFQIVFDFITKSLVFSLVFPKTSLTCPE